MTQTFKTLKDALTAGYKTVNHKEDKDITKGNFFGYRFKNSKGEKTVFVWLTDEENRTGGKGCFVALYPPRN